MKVNGVKIRSNCDWYEHGKSLLSFFLNLEKKNRFVQSQILKLIIWEKEQNKMKSTIIFSHFTKIFFLNKLILNRMTQ